MVRSSDTPSIPDTALPAVVLPSEAVLRELCHALVAGAAPDLAATAAEVLADLLVTGHFEHDPTISLRDIVALLQHTPAAVADRVAAALLKYLNHSKASVRTAAIRSAVALIPRVSETLLAPLVRALMHTDASRRHDYWFVVVARNGRALQWPDVRTYACAVARSNAMVALAVLSHLRAPTDAPVVREICHAWRGYPDSYGRMLAVAAAHPTVVFPPDDVVAMLRHPARAVRQQGIVFAARLEPEAGSLLSHDPVGVDAPAAPTPEDVCQPTRPAVSTRLALDASQGGRTDSVPKPLPASSPPFLHALHTHREPRR